MNPRLWKQGARLMGSAFAGLMLLTAAFSAGAADDASPPPTLQGLSVITNAVQWHGLSSAETSRGYPLRLEGVVTLVDTNRNLIVLQDATGALAVNLDLQATGVQAGERIRLEGDRSSPYVATFSAYPNSPSGTEWRKSFEAPTKRGTDYAARMRGYLHPPATGDYIFWIVSDNPSELWLSANEDPAGAALVTFVKANGSTKPKERSRFPSQRSKSIFLEAGKTYYIEAVYEQGSGDDYMGVNWEGPQINPTVIDGTYLSPGEDLHGQDRALNGSESTNGLYWEYYAGYYADTVQPLTDRQTPSSIVSVANPQVTHLGQGVPPAPRPFAINQTLGADDDYCWGEVAGTVDFAAKDGNGLKLDLLGNDARISVLVQDWPDNTPPQWAGLHVRVRGVCQQTINTKGDRVTGIVYAPSVEDVSMTGYASEFWSSVTATPICELEPANPNAAWGRQVVVRGTVVKQNPGGPLVIQGGTSLYSYVSTNGFQWSPAAPPVEIAASNPVLVGLTVSSHTTNTMARATFNHVFGLTTSAQYARIDNSVPRGSYDFDGLTAVLKGGGRGIRHNWDQLEFLCVPAAEDGEITAQLGDLQGNNPQANAGIMVRESYNTHASFVCLGFDEHDGMSLQYRAERGQNLTATKLTGFGRPCWMKLAHRHPLLAAYLGDSIQFQPGQPVELVGFLDWIDDKPVLRAARCRVNGQDNDTSLANSAPPDTGTNEVDSDVTKIRLINAQVGDRARPGGLLRIRGVVTFADHVFGKDYLAVQDDTGGIFVEFPNGSKMRPLLRPGQLVELEGYRVGKSFQPNSAGILGWDQMPTPVVHPGEYDMVQRGDGNWVQLDGIVQSVDNDGTMTVMTKEGAVTAWVDQLPSPGSITNYLNALVRLRGVTTWSEENGMLLVPSPGYVESLELPPNDPFAIPSIPISSVAAFNTSFQAVHRLKVEGVVTYRQGGSFYLQDASGGIAVQTAEGSTLVNEGDWFEVVGFPQGGADSRYLSEALLRKKRAGKVPAPAESSIPEMLKGRRDAMLVQLRAVLLGQQYLSSGAQMLDLEVGKQAVRATLAGNRGHLAAIPIGSLVQVTGVCNAERFESPVPGVALENESLVAAFDLLLRTPGDVVVLQWPSWWTWKHAAVVVSAMLTVLLGAVIWIHVLRQQVAERTRGLRQTMDKLEKETQISATLAERDRLAGEIHDGIQQGLSGIMMQLNGVASTMAENPTEARGFLELAQNMVRYSHTELRHSLLNLKSSMLADADLGAALGKLAKQMNGLSNTNINTVVAGTARPLPSSAENHLFRIGQEAINNAIKHAQARNIQIKLAYTDDSVRLSVNDDGCGFNQATVLTGIVGSHFGLRNLQDRARKMGGHLTVVSEPGHGATIEVTVPLIQYDTNPLKPANGEN